MDGKFHLRKLLSTGNNIFQLTAITLFTFAVMSWLVPDTFFTMRNLRSMSFQFPELGMLSLAMMLAMLTGGIDLSIVGIANLASILSGFVFLRFLPEGASNEVVLFFVAVVVCLAVLVGLLCGLVNGVLIAKFSVPPILATLGTMQLYTGIAVVLTKGAAVVGFPMQYSEIGNASVGGIGVPLIIFLIFLLLFLLLQKKTVFGINLYLVGTNAKAAAFSGIRTARTLVLSYMLSGALASIAGIIMTARTNAAKADYGASYILQSILVAVLGGTNPSGGNGNAAGILMAVLSLQFLSSGFNMLRFSNFAKEFIWGVFLLAIMIVNFCTNERHKT